MLTEDLKDVSVPLRGMWFEMQIVLVAIKAGNDKFPSPYGECGLKSKELLLSRKQSKVSVPLRGMWFEIVVIASSMAAVSGFRPLTGNVV